MWIIPSWAIGVGVLIIVVGATQVVVRRLLGRVGWSPAEHPSEPDLSRLTQVLEDVQRRLGEIEERMDFAERLLAKERDPERLAP
ncbi:MAG TPA: hypothetical protein VKO86_15130 [Gemmatimonadales bacterium]|jgi:hypothetical protein|nr:hypothetical protein [Gemmatimonadales bacterium]